ncbi:MAG: type II toxin-antitoxin system RelE/ParE family toxin [Magnetococcus sp. YQC-5]
MPYRIIIPPQVQKQLDALPLSNWRRVSTAIDRLADAPRPLGSKKLHGSAEFWRIRAGDYRIIYTIEDDRLVVILIKIGHRREVYR